MLTSGLSLLFLFCLVTATVLSQTVLPGDQNEGRKSRCEARIEGKGVTQTTKGCAYKGVQRFNSLTSDQTYYNYVTDLVVMRRGNRRLSIRSTYEEFTARNNDPYCGLETSGTYIETKHGSNVTLTDTQGLEVNAFGTQIGGVDGGNSLEMYNGNRLLGSFNPLRMIEETGHRFPQKRSDDPDGAQCAPGFFYVTIVCQERITAVKFFGRESGFESDKHMFGLCELGNANYFLPSVAENSEASAGKVYK